MMPRSSCPHRKGVLLISPAPIDGYPPTQYQARMLADEGFDVKILTSELRPQAPPEFSYPNVEIVRVALQGSSLFKRLIGKAIYAAHLLRWRLSLRNKANTEIAYDPEGVFYANCVPARHKWRITHMHEMMIHPEERFYERYTLKHLTRFDLIVVADEQRAFILQDQAQLKTCPLVVRNVPLRHKPSDSALIHPTLHPFSVVYHGVIGKTQALDSVVRSIPLWPKNIDFYIYGNPNSVFRTELDAIAVKHGVSNRIHYQGWIPLAQIGTNLCKHSIGVSLLRPIYDNSRYAVGASNKRYQYMQCGLPQISDCNPGVEELIEGNGIGLCVNHEDPAAIAKAITYYHDNPQAYTAASTRALDLHINHFYYEREFRPVLNFILERQIQ